MKLTLKSFFNRRVLVTIFIFISPILTLYILFRFERLQEINSLVGQYKIDTIQTQFGGYENDINLYAKLELELKEDQTFTFNMSVPFIRDSFGIWYQQNDGSEGTWYQMRSNNDYYGFNHFAALTKETFGYDGIYLNSTAPKLNQEFVPQIYFIKK